MSCATLRETASGGSEPTVKQLGLVASLCRELSEGIPAHALVDRVSMSSYIDQLMSRKATSSVAAGSVGSFSTEDFAEEGGGNGGGGGSDASPGFLDSTPPPARFPY